MTCSRQNQSLLATTGLSLTVSHTYGWNLSKRVKTPNFCLHFCVFGVTIRCIILLLNSCPWLSSATKPTCSKAMLSAFGYKTFVQKPRNGAKLSCNTAYYLTYFYLQYKGWTGTGLAAVGGNKKGCYVPIFCRNAETGTRMLIRLE